MVADSACASPVAEVANDSETSEYVYVHLYLLLFSPWWNFGSQPLRVSPVGLAQIRPRESWVARYVFF